MVEATEIDQEAPGAVVEKRITWNIPNFEHKRRYSKEFKVGEYNV